MNYQRVFVQMMWINVANSTASILKRKLFLIALWAQFNAKDNGFIEQYSDSLEELSQMLDSVHVNYHYGDETIIEHHASIDGEKFRIGQQKYSVIVLPKVNNISRAVKKLLEKYIDVGGTVLAVENSIEQIPLTVDGELDLSINKLLKKFVWFATENELAKNIHNYAERCLITNRDTGDNLPNIVFTSRYFNDLNGYEGKLYYFVNSCQDKQFSSRIKLSGKSAQVINPETGEFESAQFASCDDNSIKILYDFVESGALLLFVSEERIWGPKSHKNKTADCPRKELDGDFDLRLKSENALTIDRYSFFIDDKLIAEDEDVSVIKNYLLRIKEPVNIKLEFYFDIADSFDLSQELFLVIENPEMYKIGINDTEISNKPCGIYLDNAFSRLALNSCVHGKNKITLKTIFQQDKEIYNHIKRARIFEAEANKLSFDMEIVPIYVIGNFAVKSRNAFTELDNKVLRCENHFYLDNLPETCNNQTLVENGLMFFAGTIVLSKKLFLTSDEIANRTLKFDQLMACHATIRVNGKLAGELYWHPFELNLAEFLKPGENTIEIELTNGLRNLLGPHHLEEGESGQVTPFSFLKEEDILGRIPNSYNHEYNFVKLVFSGSSIV